MQHVGRGPSANTTIAVKDGCKAIANVATTNPTGELARAAPSNALAGAADSVDDISQRCPRTTWPPTAHCDHRTITSAVTFVRRTVIDWRISACAKISTPAKAGLFGTVQFRVPTPAGCGIKTSGSGAIGSMPRVP